MIFTWRFDNPNPLQDQSAGLQSPGGLIQPPSGFLRVNDLQWRDDDKYQTIYVKSLGFKRLRHIYLLLCWKKTFCEKLFEKWVKSEEAILMEFWNKSSVKTFDLHLRLYLRKNKLFQCFCPTPLCGKKRVNLLFTELYRKVYLWRHIGNMHYQ